ncbi:dentin sialophosphoprotein-like [Sinocyclocheilus anshuiensis]|uniref:dentin sialophosphoprotein-like n=1 Tax=Sinocyclocheilus anshuiensis TaxID=1608454 RepID=UPI0007BACB30|nr:PREDICTED: dentin sialophosphoprotein-like [Sinocyclocheilus anshuiensis]
MANRGYQLCLQTVCVCVCVCVCICVCVCVCRGEFDSEGSPDLYKDLYLQDIHCVSSLCKAYFRELPNPLLTYELYDRFADAVAIQLEDERLVKIKEVLKDLPALHHRTLEYLMRHLVKMSTFASQTNMHARNLAIVWAPNLLRSKDIESTGFNGTAAFMEVRVQSIVVEFILTHVAEVFSGSGLSVERRKSLPSPSILSTQDDHLFKSLPLHCPGNLSPGDGPPPMRPYHAIIDGTDKRKGSLKGRKWRSIFNLGGRLQDQRKKNKYCPKDKEKTALRPAKSMETLSSGPYALEDSKHPPPLVLSTVSGSSEGMASAGGGVSSGYAVTYRRTGGAQVSMVSGGTPGTYNRLESGGGAEGVSQGVARSPGMTSKADRRAGIHISGPFSVTVPLHITSGLALGVLHGGWNDKEQPLQGDEAEDEDVKSIETESTDGNPQSKNYNVQERERETNSYVESQVDCGKDMAELTRNENNVPEKGDSPCGKEAEKENLSQNQESMKENVKDTQPQNKEETTEEDYVEMRGNLHQEPISPHYYEGMEFPDPDLPLDFQEAFGFLDLMDSCAANPVEFSVEAPCFENEYEEEEDENKDNQADSCPSQNCTNEHQTPAAKSSSPSFTHRPLPGKSHSLPYKSRPFLPAPSLSSDDEYSPADDDESDKGSEYEDMFCQSLPACRDYQGLSWLSPQTTAGSSTSNDVDLHTSNQSNALPPENNNDAQSIDQSEDAIPAASASTDRREPAFDPSLCEEHLSSAVLKTDEVRMDEKKNDERESKNALPPENNNDAQSIDQSEDAIPAASASTDNSEPAFEPLLSEEHLSSDALKADEVCVDEKKNEDRHSKDVENDKHTLIGEDDPKSEASEEDTYFGPDSIPSSPEPDQTETDGTSVPEPIPALSPAEDAQQVLDADGYHGNSEVTITDELKDADRVSLTPQDQPPEEQTLIINQTKTEEGQKEEDEKTEETMKETMKVVRNMEENEGEECEDSNKTDAGEGKSEDVEEDAKAGSVEECSDGNGEQKQVNTTERKQDLDENSGDCEENAKDGPKEEAKRHDLEKNSGECEEGDEGHAKEEEQEAKRQEDLEGNSGESERVDEELTKEGEQDKNEAERKEDLTENNGECEENANDGPKEGEQDRNEAERQEDFEENSEENVKDGSKEEAKQDLEKNSGECEEIDEEHTKEGEQDQNKAERQEDLDENSGDCEENAKDGPKEEAKRQDLEKNSGECEEIDEEHAKEEEQEVKNSKENNGESESVDEEHTKEGEQDQNKAERQEDLEESREGNSEEDVNVKTESSAEGDLSPEGGDDPEKSTLVQRPDKMQHEQTESKEAPRKRSPRKAANATKAVPAVPPRPQTSKLTAFTLRKQLQHRQHDDKAAQADQEHAAETKTAHRDEDESAEIDTEGPGERREAWDGGADRRRDADREAKRNSGISMCFDEAVARATEKRSRERESTERLSGVQLDRESQKDGKTD